MIAGNIYRDDSRLDQFRWSITDILSVLIPLRRPVYLRCCLAVAEQRILNRTDVSALINREVDVLLFIRLNVGRMCIYSISHFPFSFAMSISFCPCSVIKPCSIIFIARSLFRFPHLLLGFLGVNFK